MTVTSADVLERLRRVKGPDLDGNIVDLGLVSEVLVKNGHAYFSITVPASRAVELEPLRQAAEKVVKDIPELTGVSAVLTADNPKSMASSGASAGRAPESPRVQAARGQAPASASGHAHAPNTARKPTTVDGVKHIIAVASGKGGVGKSTTAVNLALGFKAIGLRAGILDADIYGPSQPRLLGLTGRPRSLPDKRLAPMQAYGLDVMSMGFMVDEDTPVIWRGPMVVSALTQMLRDVAWGLETGSSENGGSEKNANKQGQLDVLVIDMPPGTGDIQLTMAQQVPLAGAVIVSTPQDLALIDARKGLNMFRKVDVPVLGIIENMSYFICSKCGERHDIFGHGGAEAEATKLGVPFLGAIPLHIDIRKRSDSGQPITVSEPESAHAQIYREIAACTWAELEASQGRRPTPPTLTITDGGRELETVFASSAPIKLSAEMLRVMSPSAEVQGHAPDQRVTVAGKRNVTIRQLETVGNYAVRITFDDGHSTGIFTWPYLQLLNRERDKRWSDYLAELASKKLSR